LPEQGPATGDAADLVVAWRYWQLAAGRRLRSVSQRGVVWAPGRALHARCRGGDEHAAPDPGCSCGIYGAVSLDALWEHGVCLGPEALVVGEVALWGVVLPDGLGYRAASAYPRRLAVVAGTLPDGSVAQLVESLGAYGVPVEVTSRDQAVGDVSATIMGFLAMSRTASTLPAAPAAGSPDRGREPNG